MRKKIVFIGAGSAMFTKGLVLDILERRNEKWHIALVDADPTALSTITAICTKMIAHMDADAELSFSTERKDLLTDADYVVCTIGVGGRRAWEQDVFIPRKYGIYQPVGDTIGPGGISRAMRMIPPMVAIARDVAELCPNALMFNYSNPMTMICMAIRRAANFPVIGLCHGVTNGMRRIASFLSINPSSLSYTACGLNHMVFCYHLRHNGEDLFPKLIKKLDATSLDGRAIGQLTAHFVRSNRAYVVSDDRHFAEFVPAVMAKDAYFGKTLGIGDKPFSGTFSFEKTIALGDEIFEQYERYAVGADKLPDDFFLRDEGEHEQLLDIIAAMDNDKPNIFYANLPNNSAVAKLPDDVVVERPALFSGSGVQPLQLPDFPASLFPAMMRYAGVFELGVKAALDGDALLMRCAIEESSIMLAPGQAQKLTDELIAAQRDYLPQF